MTRHFAWRPQVDRDPLFNPFIPLDQTRDRARLEEYDDGLEDVEDTTAASGSVPGDSGARQGSDVRRPEPNEPL